MHPAEGVRRGEERLRRLDDDAVVGVDDVGDRHLGDLRAELVGVHRVQALELADPVHELGVGDPPRVLHRAARAHRHPVGVVLDPWPAGRAALDELDDEGGGHRALHGRAAGLALALPVVPVADREHRPLDVDAEEDGRAGPHLRSVHVAAEPVGHEGRTHLSPGRGDANGAEHRLDRELDPVVAVPCHESDCAAITVELVNPRRVGKRLLQGDDAVGARHAAEEGDGRRGAPVPCRFQRDEVEHERVAGFRALDVERAGLRVDETQVDLGAR